MQVNKLNMPLQALKRISKYVNSCQSVSVLVECIIITDDLIIIYSPTKLFKIHILLIEILSIK